MPIKPHLRKLNRTSSHRNIFSLFFLQSLLKNIVSSLIIHESIQTTFSKAKEAQRIADRLITYAKKGLHNPFIYKRIQSINPKETIPKLYEVLKKRFSDRPGGYTRVLRLPSRKSDSAPMAVLEYIDGPKDTRFLMIVKTIIRNENLNQRMSKMTIKNIKKVTRFRKESLTTLKNTIVQFRQFLNREKKQQTLQKY
ncbi:hypothetical protein PCANB_001942 [Pneumocystis canis]|nr:hypothetical protein PCK1_001726 [Pneumocystis canis]KAG5440371.1 hypothetical protein PCANB_001942 [Pneumocystis canis]